MTTAGMEITPLIGGFGKYIGPIDFKADHPFLYYLIDRENQNIPIFMGRMVNPLVDKVQVLNRNAVAQPSNRNRLNSVNSDPIASPTRPILTPRPPTQPPRIKPVAPPTADLDDIIFSPGMPYSGFFNHIRRNSKVNDVFPSQQRQESHDSVVFPDDHSRRRRRDMPTNSNAVEEAATTQDPSTTDQGGLNERIKDPNWHKRPIDPEVIISSNSVPAPKPQVPRPVAPPSVLSSPPVLQSQHSPGVIRPLDSSSVGKGTAEALTTRPPPQNQGSFQHNPVVFPTNSESFHTKHPGLKPAISNEGTGTGSSGNKNQESIGSEVFNKRPSQWQPSPFAARPPPPPPSPHSTQINFPVEPPSFHHPFLLITPFEMALKASSFGK